MLTSEENVGTIGKLPPRNHRWVRVDLERSVSPFLSYHLRMQKVGGFCFVLIQEEHESLSTMKVTEEATWQSKLSGTQL